MAEQTRTASALTQAKQQQERTITALILAHWPQNFIPSGLANPQLAQRMELLYSFVPCSGKRKATSQIRLSGYSRMPQTQGGDFCFFKGETNCDTHLRDE